MMNINDETYLANKNTFKTNVRKFKKFKLSSNLTMYLLDFFSIKEKMQLADINKLFRTTIENKQSFNIKKSCEKVFISLPLR